jgi:hypothetical protein
MKAHTESALGATRAVIDTTEGVPIVARDGSARRRTVAV